MTRLQIIFSLLLAIGMYAPINMAQNTGFTYQGNLKAGGVDASGSHDFEFALFNAESGGSQLGSTVTQNGVTVTNGIFAVTLDFGNQFPGGSRFLEIRVRPTGGVTFTTLNPRQPVSSTPYAIKSLNSDTAATATNATQLGGVAANQFVQTADPRLSDARPPTAGSSNYVQNTTTLQSVSNFNISGTGTANVFNSTSDYNIFGFRVLSILGTNNAFVGIGAGTANSGSQNAFFGREAGEDNTNGSRNSFFGGFAGRNNLTASDLAFFGADAGSANLSGANNSFFGSQSGRANTTGMGNSFFGKSAGQSNVGGSRNSFFGAASGGNNISGQDNTFAGSNSGASVSSGSNNSFFGSAAGQLTGSAGNNSFFGNASGIVNTGGSNSFFGSGSGFGTTSGNNNSFFGNSAAVSNTTGSFNTVIGDSANVGSGNLSFATAIGAQAVVGTSNTVVLGRPADTIQIPGTLSLAGTLTASIFNATTQYNIEGERAFTMNSGNFNVFLGTGAGGDLNTGGNNSFFGGAAGEDNTGSANSFFGRQAGSGNTTGNSNSFFGRVAGSANTTGSNNTAIGSLAGVGAPDLNFATAIGAGAIVNSSNRIQLGRQDGSDDVRVSGNLILATLGGAGATALCRNLFLQVATCSSSLRYKTNIDRFGLGLDLINQFKPITFDWKDGGMRDLGLGAEDVAAIEPLLVTYNAKGEVEGVKYDRIGVILVNAVKEQQAQIESQRTQIERQNARIDALTKFLCSSNKDADICKVP